jgi:hypothetical protein
MAEFKLWNRCMSSLYDWMDSRKDNVEEDDELGQT